MVLGSSCNPVTPKEAAEKYSKASCAKMYSCPDVPSKIGPDQSSCETFMYGLTFGSIDGKKCKDGSEIPLNDIVVCSSDIEKQSCEAFKAEEKSPACKRFVTCTSGK